MIYNVRHSYKRNSTLIFRSRLYHSIIYTITITYDILKSNFRPAVGKRFRIPKHLTEDRDRKFINLSNCLTPFAEQHVRLIKDRRDPPLLCHWWQRDLNSTNKIDIKILDRCPSGEPFKL